ncbi:hypothetical protein DSM112329_00424 [Paraconexibacter sp. AEG42_29]|uniref:Uncharacterized protein n=1 Tax=Paraconexibacter sp. AEG42_29 TaxID=2997339 RepID=A0AAU7APR8_9ACTN
MIRRTTTARLAGAALAAAVLAVPAAASAHPGIFTLDAKIVRPGAPTPPTVADAITQRQYAILNDGYVTVLRESNGITDTAKAAVPASGNEPAQPATVAGGGMLNYKLLPGAIRANTAAFPDKASWLAYLPARSDVQAHATCANVPALESTPNILAWQNDPFYRYIPWQKTSAGIADEPAKWIPVVKTATGVDLSTLTSVDDFTKACTALGGTYAPADATVTLPPNASSASIADAVAPVTAAKVAAEAAADAANARAAAAETARAAAVADVQRLQLAATPLRLTLTAPPTLKTLPTAGVPVRVTGAPLTVVRVRLLTTDAKAKALKLKSRVFATATVTLDATGASARTLKPTAAAGRAIQRGKGSLALTVDAVAGDRSAGLTSILKAGK